MPAQSEKSRSTITELVAWCIATPILSIWALVSLLPVASVISAWGDAGEVLIALAFLATGGLGLAVAAVGYRLLLWEKASIQVVSSEKRTFRAVAISAYAVVWMALYAL